MPSSRHLLFTAAGLVWVSTLLGAQAPAVQSAAYKNIQVLKSLSTAEVDAVMKTSSEALGVGCEHCHVPDQWHLDTKPAFATARNMYRMVEALNSGPLSGTGGVACWTCHAGNTRPARFPGDQLDAALAKWPADLPGASDGLKITMTVYSMSLGVECSHCHAPGDWKAPTPAFKQVATMNSMFKLFPAYMPAGARTQCWMCHKGSKEPKRTRGAGLAAAILSPDVR